MGRVNVLHIYQNSKVGGIQQQLVSLLRAYDREILNPTVCCFGPKREIGGEIEKLGIEIVALNRTRYSKFTPGIVRDIYRLIKDRDIHVLRTHKYRANLYGRLAGWLAGVPVVISSEHNIYREKEKRLYRRIINKVLSGCTDKVIAVSEAVENDMLAYDGISPSKIMVIYNGVDMERFSPERKYFNIRREFSIDDDSVVVGFIGRLVHNKGLEYLLMAFGQVKQRHHDTKLIIVGDGSLMQELKGKARDLGIGDSVVFTGLRRDVPDLLASMDVFVMPSVKEGLGNSILEAMVMRKPVVATDVGGIPEIVQNGRTGLVVPPARHSALAEAIMTLITDRRLAAEFGEAAEGFIREGFSIKATAGKWQHLYESLLEEKGVVL
jgi:glycosyltransferase involved in cell wall biosynthesis